MAYRDGDRSKSRSPRRTLFFFRLPSVSFGFFRFPSVSFALHRLPWVSFGFLWIPIVFLRLPSDSFNAKFFAWYCWNGSGNAAADGPGFRNAGTAHRESTRAHRGRSRKIPSLSILNITPCHIKPIYPANNKPRNQTKRLPGGGDYY